MELRKYSDLTNNKQYFKLYKMQQQKTITQKEIYSF